MLLTGVVGSTAYGLDTPDSDIDRLGIFAHDTVDTFALNPRNPTIVTTKPDVTYHEAAKALRLLLGCNPAITELLWLNNYETRTPLGAELLSIRHVFLSAGRVRDAYLGYAAQQFRRLIERGTTFGSDIPERRTAKHARHLMRLVEQGYGLYTTGQLTVRLADPGACHDFGQAVAADPERARAFMETAEERFNAAHTVLPDEPRPAIAQGWLNRVRAACYAPQPAAAGT